MENKNYPPTQEENLGIITKFLKFLNKSFWNFK